MTYLSIRPQKGGATFLLRGTKWFADVRKDPAATPPASRDNAPVSVMDSADVWARTWSESGASVVRNSESQALLIAELYDLTRPDEVLQFLSSHLFLVPLLIEARDKIADIFGHESRVVLEVITDPEAPADRELFAFVRTALPADKALQKLGQLDQDWWLDRLDDAQGKLCIHVEFQ